MVISEIDLYEVLTQQLGAEQAKAVVHFVEAKVDKRLQETKSEYILERDKDKLLTKADAMIIFSSKEDLANTKADIIKWMFIFWVGSIGVLSGVMFTMLHAYLK